MRIGALRHRVTIQSFDEGVDEAKTPVNDTTDWQDIATVYAAVEPISGKEYIQLHSTQAEVTTRIRVRHRDDILPGMRVIYHDHIYDIQAVLDILTTGRELHLMCMERVGERYAEPID